MLINDIVMCHYVQNAVTKPSKVCVILIMIDNDNMSNVNIINIIISVNFMILNRHSTVASLARWTKLR